MDIGTRLDEAMRLRGGISQSSLFRLCGVPQPTIARILKGGGKRGPETDTIKKLADALNVRFEWLNEGRGPMERSNSSAAEGRPPGWSVLARVDDYEVRMLDLIRQLDERGKRDAEESLQALVGGSEKFADPADETADRDRRRTDERGPHLGVVGAPPPKQRKL